MKRNPLCSCRQGDQGIARHPDCPIHGQEVRSELAGRLKLKMKPTSIPAPHLHKFARAFAAQGRSKADFIASRPENSALLSEVWEFVHFAVPPADLALRWFGWHEAWHCFMAQDTDGRWYFEQEFETSI
jgi:hypothetical protein